MTLNIMPKCSFCDKKAEYVDDPRNPRLFFCQEHAKQWLLEGKAVFLFKIKENIVKNKTK